MWVEQVVTYLEMTSTEPLRPGTPPAIPLDIQRADGSAVPLVARLHRRVGAPHHWTGLSRQPQAWAELLACRDVWTGVIRAGGRPAGLLMLLGQPDGNVEIATFGLAPEFVGHGLGGHALTLSVRLAWNRVDPDDLAPVRRVWLHTSSLDHPNALANYRARGFRQFWSRTNQREIR